MLNFGRHLLTTFLYLDLPQEQKGCEEALFDITADTMDVEEEEDEVGTTATLVETTTTTTTWLTQHSLQARLDLEPGFLQMGFLVEKQLFWRQF